MFIIMYFSFKFNFGKDSTVPARDKGLCCKPTNIGKNDIMCILNFVCTGFLFSFRRSFPSILSFLLIQIFFGDPDPAYFRSSLLSLGEEGEKRRPEIRLPFAGYRTTGNRMIRKAHNKYVSCSSRIPMIRHNFHITY